MQPKTRLAGAILIVTSVVAPLVGAQTYTYNVGPNWVNMSGSRCRPAVTDSETTLIHGGVYTQVVTNFSGNQTLYCPITRRATSFYQDAFTAPDSIFKKVTVTDLTLRASDGRNDGTMSCRLFASQLNGSIAFSTTRYLCSTAGGCLNSSTGVLWTGTSTLTWSGTPLGTVSSVSWGLSCSVPAASGLSYYEAVITPNPTT